MLRFYSNMIVLPFWFYVSFIARCFGFDCLDCSSFFFVVQAAHASIILDDYASTSRLFLSISLLSLSQFSAYVILNPGFLSLPNADVRDLAVDLNATSFDAVLGDTPASFVVVEFFAHCFESLAVSNPLLLGVLFSSCDRRGSSFKVLTSFL
ncbi:hypothetical protein C1H46_021274 [Malus baccata]|uniref:Uncharacterized protein n=1 Tax=Malus baccata TaxID=106549 RepID=A0A540M2Z0_MALBA|nr:hypothetical protein C1H46_021274 [Malus baccata]